MPGMPAVDILREGARALARGDALEPTLLAILGPLAERLGIASAAVFTVGGPAGALDIAASIGLGDPAALTAAVRNPAHPVTRTAVDGIAGFDVPPLAPGGPALRSHLPLIVGGGGRLVGVLALAHDQSTDSEARIVLEAVADLAAVAVTRWS